MCQDVVTQMNQQHSPKHHRHEKELKYKQERNDPSIDIDRRIQQSQRCHIQEANLFSIFL